jgi:hypothetical protein
MATALLRFDLSDEDDARQHRYALAGRDALIALEQIEQAIRSRLKHGDPSDTERVALEEIRAMIPYELTSLLT